ncbi:hypothetical protein HZS_3432 [Henneguya salminicola]|nr:hypothetical protein HZS_3432 [Henneguya salminicola]
MDAWRSEKNFTTINNFRISFRSNRKHIVGNNMCAVIPRRAIILDYFRSYSYLNNYYAKLTANLSKNFANPNLKSSEEYKNSPEVELIPSLRIKTS